MAGQFQAIEKPDIKFTQLFINNEFVDAQNGGTDDVINPATGEVLAKVQSADAADVDRAVTAAKAAFKRGSTWRTMDATARGAMLFKLADLVQENVNQIASLDGINVGKPFYSLALPEVMGAVMIMKYYAGWADKIQGKTTPAPGNNFQFTRHEPVGVCGQIIPWNYPFMMAVFKIAPAVAAGNTVVLKPSEMTPLSALFLASLVKEAGFPPGVINIIPGTGPKAGDAISRHPDVNKIAFTGSTRVGRIIGAIGAETVKRVTLELGGKSPLVVMDDADIDEAVEIAQQSCFMNSGQICIAASRIFVHEKIHDEFVRKSVELAKTRTANMGEFHVPTVSQGPQVSENQMKTILGYIQKGKDQGAKLECGGERWGDKGFYIKPTIFSGVTDDMVIAREEIFGPVMPIFKFSTFEEVLDRANDTKYGLASSILTKDMDKAFQFAQGSESGNVWINTYGAILFTGPFGGFKQSGHGRELGEYGLQNYTEVKSVVFKLSAKLS